MMTTQQTGKKSRLFGVAVLILPLIVLAGVAANADLHRNGGGGIWQIRITGYDPRDLLYGHYLTYRYDWNWKENLRPAVTGEYCLCLNGDGPREPVTSGVSCQNSGIEKICKSVVKAWNHYGVWSLNPEESSERFYIPERHAAHLDRLLRDPAHTLHVEIMAHKDGSAALRDLYIDGVRLETYLRNLPLKKKQ